MKKLLSLFAAVVCFAFAAVAQGSDLYLVGEFNGWTPGDASYKFTHSGDSYSISVASLDGQWKICGDTWDLNFGGDTGGADVPTVDAVIGDNTMWKGSSVNLVASGWSNVTVSFTWDGSAESIQVNVANGGGSVTPDPGTDPVNPGAGANLYLVGEFNGWTPGDANYKFTHSGDKYTISVASLDGQWKIVGDTWDLNFGGDTGGEDVPTVDAVIGDNTMWKGSSVNLVAGGWSNVTISFTWDGSAESIQVNVANGGGAVTPDPGTDPVNPGTGSDLYLVGEFNGWTPGDASYKFTHSGDNYSITVASLDGQWKICGDTWDLNFGGDTGGEDVPTVDAVIGDNTMWKGSSVNLVAGGWSNVTISFTWDGTTEDILVNVATGGQEPTPDPGTDPTPDPGTDPVVPGTACDLYLVGEFNGWAPGDANYKFNHSGNDYSIYVPSLDGQWKIVADTWDINFGGDTGGEDVPVVDAVEGTNIMWKGSSVNLVANGWTSVNISFTWDGTTDDIYVNVATSHSGVDTLAGEAVCGDVYTASGVRVARNVSDLSGLAKGLYIFNGKKVLVK